MRPRAGLGPAPANRRERLSTRPPDFRQGFRKAAGAALAVARDGYGIRLRSPLQGRLSAARKPSPSKGADSPYQGEMSRSDRGDRDRCPRRGRMRVPSWLARPPAGGPRASPTRTRKVSVKTVGEGTTPLIKGRYRAQRDKGDRDLPLPRAGLGPAPANRRERLSTRPPDFRQGFRKAAGAGPCGRPGWIRNQASVPFAGAAVSRPQAFPLQGGRLPLSRGDVAQRQRG